MPVVYEKCFNQILRVECNTQLLNTVWEQQYSGERIKSLENAWTEIWDITCMCQVLGIWMQIEISSDNWI